MLLSRFVHLASLVMHKPRQLRIAGYPNVGWTLRAGGKNILIRSLNIQNQNECIVNQRENIKFVFRVCLRQAQEYFDGNVIEKAVFGRHSKIQMLMRFLSLPSAGTRKYLWECG